MKNTAKKKAKKSYTKMYMATRTYTTMFLCDEKVLVKEYAKDFLDEEIDQLKHYGAPDQYKTEVKEVKSVKDIPKEWQGDALLWGTDSELTAKQWLNGERSDEELSPEYQEYLRLKEIYG
jgi:hypothetical protein